MTTGISGFPSIPWAQTRIDGREDAPVAALRPGAVWEWFGPVERLDPASSLALSTFPIFGDADLRQRVGRRARRIVANVLGPQGQPGAQDRTAQPDCPAVFLLADGDRQHRVALWPTAEPGRPCLVFLDAVPATGRPLLVDALRGAARPLPLADPAFLPGGFAAGTGIATHRGLVPVERLGPGDRVLARDGGLRHVVCAVRWQAGGGPMQLAPGLRPVTVRSGAFGAGHPFRDLRLAPGQPVAVSGPEVQALFGCPRVLVPAARLAGLPGVVPDDGPVGSVFVRLVLSAPDLLIAEGLACASADAPDPDGATPEALTAQAVAARHERRLAPGDAARLVHALGLRSEKAH